MKKIQIKENISKEEASKFKNFNNVLLKYQGLSIPFYKSPIFIGGGVLATVITAFVLSQNFLNVNKEVVYENLAYQTEYNTPIKKEKSPEIITVKLKDKPVKVKTKNGTIININPNSIVDKYGNPVEGKIDIEFTDVLDQKSIFLSGIPMKINQDGEEMVFESGGMFKLLAYKNGEPLFVKDGESIQVQLASKQVGDKFNQYYLNPETNQWEYVDKDKSGVDDKTIQEIADTLFENSNLEEVLNEKNLINEQLVKLEYQKLIKPIEQDENKQVFSINVDYSDFPELKAFKDVLFQVSDKEKNFDPSYTNILWENTTINRGELIDEFQVCFEKQEQNVCFLTNPVVSNSNYEEAKKDYKLLLKEYNAVKDSLKRRKREAAKVIAKRSKELEKQKMEAIKELNRELAVIVENKITRTFQIGKFGIWNSDIPEKMPSQAVVIPTFKDDLTGNNIELKDIFMVQKDRNVVLDIAYLDYYNGLKYNPGEECMLWAVTEDKLNVAVITVDEFNRLNPNLKTIVFNSELIPTKEFINLSTEEILNL